MEIVYLMEEFMLNSYYVCKKKFVLVKINRHKWNQFLTKWIGRHERYLIQHKNKNQQAGIMRLGTTVIVTKERSITIENLIP